MREVDPVTWDAVVGAIGADGVPDEALSAWGRTGRDRRHDPRAGRWADRHHPGRGA
ncbi:hypothetical protein [Streptomyces cremeus]|uniref:hypothetical protein n=1 Tax=Streptomyces cremeus TaxID=66881 RepID=UPI0031EB1265